MTVCAALGCAREINTGQNKEHLESKQCSRVKDGSEQGSKRTQKTAFSRAQQTCNYKNDIVKCIYSSLVFYFSLQDSF